MFPVFELILLNICFNISMFCHENRLTFVALFNIYQLEVKIKPNKKLGYGHKSDVGVCEKSSFEHIEKIPRKYL